MPPARGTPDLLDERGAGEASRRGIMPPVDYLRRTVTWVVVALAVNVVWWAWVLRPWPLAVVAAVASVVACVWFGVLPRLRPGRDEPRRLTLLSDGYELLLGAGACALANLVWWVWLGTRVVGAGDGGRVAAYVGCVVVGVLLLEGLAAGGLVRLAVASRQVGLTTKVVVGLLWWMPPVTVVMLGKVSRTVAREVATTTFRLARDRARVADQVCRTRHPLLLVHGVFFRDWKAFGYWGRIPAALEANGATISYGGQDASRPVADCAAQLVPAIERAAAATGQVNIIAHSKGGLDARWAVSRLGVADKVASLTTVNTPHHGCGFVRQLLDRMPLALQAGIGERYDAVFTRLGDPDPDVLASIADLTDTECARLNALMPDAPGVVYLSIGSRMASRSASPFPLSLGYALIWPHDGDNDGLVAVRSMPWGEYLGTVEPHGRHGLSHGDMIDLLRRDIDGFDVCELYVQLVSGLRQRGL